MLPSTTRATRGRDSGLCSVCTDHCRLCRGVRAALRQQGPSTALWGRQGSLEPQRADAQTEAREEPTGTPRQVGQAPGAWCLAALLLPIFPRVGEA